MMELSQKLRLIYPELKSEDFYPDSGTILLVNDSDGKGVYIAKWEHPTFSRPTDVQLAEIK
jgi:hypothetical protein